MSRSVLRRAGRVLALLLLLAAAACSPGAPARPGSDRARLIGAIPPQAAERGVYAFTAALGEDLSPGSLLAPVIGPALLEADLVVETGAPPLTLALGIDEGVDLPEPARRVGDVVVIGAPDDVDAAVGRLESNAPPVEGLAALAQAGPPVAWAGPAPTRDQTAATTTLVELDTDLVQLEVTTGDAEELAAAVRSGLAEGAPPQSPGKPWRTLLVEPQVTVEDGLVRVTAGRGDLPGSLLRQLIDSRSFGFLSAS